MSDIGNKERAAWAMEALKRFDEVCPCGLSDDPEDVESACADLIADIFHLLDSVWDGEGPEPDSVVRTAMGHYSRECEEEE